MTKAIELGFRVNKPYGDSSRYDVVIDNEGDLVRVQVKCTYFKIAKHAKGIRRSYSASLRSPGSPPYELSDFDYLAIYVIPVGTWYIMPIAVVHGKLSIAVTPGYLQGRYEGYREAWHLLRDRPEKNAPRSKAKGAGLGTASSSSRRSEGRRRRDAGRNARATHVKALTSQRTRLGSSTH